MEIKNILKIVFVTFFLGTNFLYANDEIEEIVVISSKYPVPLDEVVGSVNTISMEDLETRMVSDLSDMLDKTIGVSVSRSNTSGRSYNEGITIRGLGGKRVNILIDGVRVADAYTGYGRDVVEVDLLKRVEILKGPSSALYGSDGLAGAVSYITKDPSDLAEFGENYFSINTSYDEDSEQTKAGFLAARTGETLESLLQVTVRERSELELHDDSTKALDPFDGEQLSILAKFKLNLSESVNLSITLDSQEFEGDYVLGSQTGMSYYPAVVNTSAVLGMDEGSRDRGTIALDFSNKNRFFDNASMKIFAQETDQKQITTYSKQSFGEMGPPTPLSEYKDYQFNQSIDGLTMDFFKTISGADLIHNLVYGMEIENVDVERPRIRYEANLMTGDQNTFLGGEYYPNKTIPDTEIERQSFFFNDRMDLNDKTSIVFGARYDSYELNPQPDALYTINEPANNNLLYIDDNEISAKVGFIHKFEEGLSLFAQYAEGFRAPDFQSANLSFTNLAYYYSVKVSPGLEPEESEGFEIGLRGSSEDSSWSIAVYDNNYEKFIDSYMTGMVQGMMVFEYGNLDEVDITGLEFDLKTDISENLQASFAFNVTSGDQNGEELLSVDPDEALLGLSWSSSNSKLKISGYANIVAGSPDNLAPSCGRSGCVSALELSGLTTYDVYASYAINPNLIARLAIRNLSDESYWNWSSVKGKSSNDANLDLFMEPGRNISMGLKYQF
tara:strand:- start:149 stop:2329 length:2181 start_codon:yes stop_codon:yes gene_type:complete